jgi:hypothetical protein
VLQAAKKFFFFFFFFLLFLLFRIAHYNIDPYCSRPFSSSSNCCAETEGDFVDEHA